MAQPVSLGPTAKPYLPELVICIAAATGTDTRAVTESLSAELRSVGYDVVLIRLSSLMSELPGLEYLRTIEHEDERIRESMAAGHLQEPCRAGRLAANG